MKSLRHIPRCLAAALLAATLIGCGGKAIRPRPATPLTLTILHVNDTHSHLEPNPAKLRIDGTDTYLELGGYARLATQVAAVRQTHPNPLLLHAGDAVQGTLYYTKYQGAADTALLNRLGIDAMTVGNHAFDNGPRALAAFLDEARFPVISANLDTDAEPTLAGRIPDRIIRDYDGEQVAIVGLIVPETAYISKPGPTVTFADHTETAKAEVADLTARGINKIILLTHLGYELDRRLAREVAGIDLIVGGHSHSLLGDFSGLGLSAEGPYPTRETGPTGDPVLIVQSWEWAKAVGMLTVEFDAAGRITDSSGNAVLLAGEPFRRKDAAGARAEVDAPARTRILEWIAARPDLEVVPEDPEITALLAPYQAGVAAFGNEVIGRAAADLLHIRVPGLHPSGTPLPNGSLLAPAVCNALLWKTDQVGLDADLAIQNAGLLRIDIPAGEITVGDAFTLLPFGSTLYVLDLTGAQITSALEEGLETALSDISDGAFPYVGKARYTADAARPPGSRITRLAIQGPDGSYQPLDPNKTYRVITNSYLAGGGDGYATFKASTGYRYDTGFIDAEVFMEYLKAKGALTPTEETGVTFLTKTGKAIAAAMP